MGTKAKCTRCGAEKWVNTSKLKGIHETFNVRPKDWLKSNYICKDCAKRVDLIKNTTPETIKQNLDTFAAECKSIYYGLFSNGSISEESYSKFISNIKSKLVAEGIHTFNLLKFKNIIIGMSVDIPIIGKIKIDFIN